MPSNFSRINSPRTVSACLSNNGPETTLVSYRLLTNDPKNAVAEYNQHRFSQLLWAKEQTGWVVVALSLLQAAKYS